ncbi:MAG TPA: hypothetical protein VKD72_17135, partial [Gemmataceae bacterium]|nr:hypothetical protein [Gemmataceae bacterium]
MHLPEQRLSAPLYIEVSTLLHKPLTGVGRFAARLLEALIPLTSVRLVSTLGRDRTRGANAGVPLARGEEIAVDASRVDCADGDLTGWVRRLLSLPRRRHDAGQAARSPGLYTWLR